MHSAMPAMIWTINHSTRSFKEFPRLLAASRIEVILGGAQPLWLISRAQIKDPDVSGRNCSSARFARPTPSLASCWHSVGRAVPESRRNCHLDPGNLVRARIEASGPRRDPHRLIRHHENITPNGSDYAVRNAAEQCAS